MKSDYEDANWWLAFSKWALIGAGVCYVLAAVIFLVGIVTGSAP